MTSYEVDILKKALLKAERKEVERFKKLPCEDVTFSEEFENSIEKLAKKRKSFAWQATKTVPRRIAVALIAAIITFCLMMSISAVRETVVNFFVNVSDEFIHIIIKGDDSGNIPDRIEEPILPSHIPEGYTLEESKNYGNMAVSIWLNENGNYFALEQKVLSGNSDIHIDKIDFQTEKLGNVTLYYGSKNGTYLIMWSTEYYTFTIVCPDSIPFDEIKTVISSMNL